eukprot:CAMPEP_0119391176 /NCGR_PEP_ID=MMETSP1334-20130426/116180_1 /TAXON_ID=127549 /ORGANISM="Calcidiscus leptoporus, Strain RCC1130" /LENGTH=36 /DNA_ID= /DNA_START= /DNA_END= /DNA_ORIENTATION=
MKQTLSSTASEPASSRNPAFALTLHDAAGTGAGTKG